MNGLLDPRILQGLLYLYPKQNVDPSGFPIDVTRPVVFGGEGNYPQTEYTATFKASELGLPGKGFYNVPTIYNGQILDPDKDFELIKQNVQAMSKGGTRLPFYKTLDEAKGGAISRSKSIGELRGKELEDAVRKRQSNMFMGLLGY